MSMVSLVQAIVPDGKLVQTVADQARAEAGFTREIGVLARCFYQCIQQPHVWWAATEWTHQGAHDDAAEGLMKIRRDDRVAAACFRPGLYFEIFGRPIEAACRAWDGPVSAGRSEQAGFVLVIHATVADKAFDGWAERVAARTAALDDAPPDGLLSIQLYENYHGCREFVAFLGFRDEAAYAAAHHAPGAPEDARRLEERLYVQAPHSDLSGYNQFECRPLVFPAAAPAPETAG
jgi:hypothetical protein